MSRVMLHVKWTRLMSCHAWKSHMCGHSKQFTLMNMCIIMHGGYCYFICGVYLVLVAQ